MVVLCAVLAVASNKLDKMIEEKQAQKPRATKDGWKLD